MLTLLSIQDTKYGNYHNNIHLCYPKLYNRCIKKFRKFLFQWYVISCTDVMMAWHTRLPTIKNRSCSDISISLISIISSIFYQRCSFVYFFCSFIYCFWSFIYFFYNDLVSKQGLLT